ncbi:MAG TPA: META domain-containing protein [Thermodesulfobacteriota bacterium]|nr:META domain-containing protein [Thermodesulfobacteriota bacterium]
MKTKVFLLLSIAFLLSSSVFGRDPLEGTKWKLTGWTISSIDPKDVNITLNFSGGKVSGSGGVNSYSGPCETKPDGSFIAGEISFTLIAGPEPAMRAEAAYFKLLGDARFFKIKGDMLTLYDGMGNEMMSFEIVKV